MPSGTRRQGWWSFGIFLAFSIVFSWPWARFDDQVLLQRHFDLYGVLWALDYAREYLPDFRAVSAGGLAGQDLGRLDSFTLAFLGWLLHGFLSPLRTAQLIVLLGPALNAWAAERCARKGLGVAWPWSLVAGFAFGFNGLAATALLEGHVNHLLDPWLPLMVLALIRASSPGARTWDGVMAGLMYVLSLLTTGYLGVDGAVIVLAFAARALVLRAGHWSLLPVAAAAAGVVVAPTASWLYLMVRQTGSMEGLVRASNMSGTSAMALTTWSPAIDEFDHSQAAPLGFALLALALTAPLLFGRRRGTWTLLGLAVLAAVLAPGPVIRMGPTDPDSFHFHFISSLHAPFAGLVRFPIRFLWIYYLCAGLVAARVVGELAGRTTARWAGGLVAVVVVECLLTTAVPFRIQGTPAAPHPAYEATRPDDRLFELFAESPDSQDDSWIWIRQTACYQQTLHHRPVLHQCIGTSDDPHLQDSRELIEAIFDLDVATPPMDAVFAGEIVDSLNELGADVVIVHHSSFDSASAAKLERNLARVLGQEVVRSHETGETLVVYRVPEPDES